MPRRVTSPAMLRAARNLRRRQTPAETILWECLRDRRLDGVKFKRQAMLKAYIADFYCAESHLVIELDGSVHDKTDVKLSDRIRQRNLEVEGYAVLRFSNSQVEHDIASVLDAIRTCLKSRRE